MELVIRTEFHSGGIDLKKLMVLTAFFLLSACTDSQSGSSSASWAFPFVKWEGHVYVITDDTVPSKNIGRMIGKVTRYSDVEGTEGQDNFSNAFKKGTVYYEINGGSTENQLAVKKENGTYIKAVEESVWRKKK